MARNITVADLRDHSPLVDYFVIAEGSSSRNAAAIADNIEDRLLAAGYPIKKVYDGKDSGWYLVDCYDVVAHIFFDDYRRIYNLEGLWKDLIK